VEEIVAFLHGLKGMPESVQTQALKAMDDADPNWSIADVVLDGRYKVDALQKARGAVDQQVANARQEALAEVAAQEAYLAEARTTIDGQIQSLRDQIAELQQLLVAEESQVEERKGAARDQIAALERQADSEHARIQTEIGRITQIVNAFGPMAQES
jgi:chromosome segregation ATPase